VNTVYQADALSILSSLPCESIDLIYTDPPFGTGARQQAHRQMAGQEFPKMGYSDRFDDYMGFLVPHLRAFRTALKTTGTMYLHLDPRWSHYAKVECDKIFGYDNFMSEVIWSYNFGGRGKNKWPAKHDVILVYAKELGKHTFNWDDIDRVPYAAPAMQRVGRSKAEAEKRIAAGQVPTDVWSMSIVGTASKERTGYPNQKPLRLVKRVVTASSNPGDTVLDPFCGSGTTGLAAASLAREFILVDQNPQAIQVTSQRLNKLMFPFVLK